MTVTLGEWVLGAAGAAGAAAAGMGRGGCYGAGCVREYMATAQKYASLSLRLAAAIKEAKGKSTPKQVWTRRHGFDDVFAHGTGGMGRGGAFGSWIWILACCVFVGFVGAAVRSTCLKRRGRGGHRVAVFVGAEGAQNGAVVSMVAVTKMDPTPGGARGGGAGVRRRRRRPRDDVDDSAEFARGKGHEHGQSH